VCVLAFTVLDQDCGVFMQIRLKVEKTQEDIEAEHRRADLLASLNAFYD
jgi:hypothetical protein